MVARNSMGVAPGRGELSLRVGVRRAAAVSPARGFSPVRRFVGQALALGSLILSGCGAGPLEAPSPPPSPTPEPRVAVEGQVLLAGRGQAGGVQVFVPGRALLALTDPDGRFRFDGLAPGPYRFMAQHPGYRSVLLGELELLPEGRDVAYQLAPAVLDPLEPPPSPTPAPAAVGTIAGRVRSLVDEAPAEGLDLSGGRVALEGTAMRTVTEPDGSFFFWSVPPGSYRVHAELRAHEPAFVDLELAAGQTLEGVLIDLPPLESRLDRREITGRIELILTDGTRGTDFQAVRLGLKELPESRPRLQPDGTFRLGPLAPRPYTLQASADGFAPVEDRLLDLAETSAANVVVTLEATRPMPDQPGWVVGRALKNDPEAPDHRGIAVALAGTSIVGLTDAAGNYRLAGAPPGLYEALAQAEGYEPQSVADVRVEPGEEVRLEDIRLEKTLVYPEVVETDPAPGTRDFMVHFEMPIFVRFNKKMRPESLRRAVALRPNVGFHVYGGREHPESDFDLMVVVIDGGDERRPVRHDTAYELTISTAAEDFEGLRLQRAFALAFRTSRPGVMDTRPAHGARDVVLNPAEPVIVRFNATIDPRSVDPRMIRIRPSVPGVPTVQTVDDVRTGWTQLHIQSAWAPDTRYQITLPSRLRTTTGQSLANAPFTFEFQTAKARPLPALDRRGPR